jgi:hypothetical protein
LPAAGTEIGGYEILLFHLLFIKEIVIYRKVESLFLTLLEYTVMINERNSAKFSNLNPVPAASNFTNLKCL